MMACQNDNKEIVEMLLSSGANVNLGNSVCDMYYFICNIIMIMLFVFFVFFIG